MKKHLFDALLPLLPKDDLSRLVGRLVHAPLPEPLAGKSVEWFARAYRINMEEAEHPLSHYRTIGELFTRKLKPGVRPIGEGVVHPADSVITEAGVIENQTLIQAKGKTYSVAALLAGGHRFADFEGGSFLTYYLCPTDYHRVHSPIDGEIVWSCHVPGELWPVNAWSVNAISQLFAANERVVVMIQTPRGRAALVMVAATNVGNMSFSFDQSLGGRERGKRRQPRERAYQPPVSLERGEELGIFHMGSTVVMLFEKSLLAGESVSRFKGQAVQMGQSLIGS